MMKTSIKTLKTTKPMMTMRMRIKMKIKTSSTTNTIESTRRNLKTYYKTKENKPIPTNIVKMRARRRDEAEGDEEEPEDDGTAIISERETDSKGSELRRSTRESRPVSRLEPNMSGKSYLQNYKKIMKKVAFAEDELKQLEYCHNLVCQVKAEKEKIIEYGSCQVMLIARFIQDITMNVNQHGASFAQQYMLQKGLKVFGEKGHDASKKEIDQLHKRTCFAPLKVKEMKPSERKKAQMALMFLTEKRDKSVKGRMVYNGKPT
jgi:hypothetical protein